MKKILLVALLVGIVAISGCVQETPEPEVETNETMEGPPVQEQQQVTQTQSKSYDPLTASEIADITDKIDDLSSDYEVVTFTSTDDLSFVSIKIYSTYRETDMTRIFKYMRADSDTKEYEIQIVKDMGSSDTSDDVICSYRDSAEKIDGFTDINWNMWQDNISLNTCSV